MRVFVHAEHGEIKPIGNVFVSYARDDVKLVDDQITALFRAQQIPYFIDYQDMGAEKFIQRIRDLIEDSSCGVVSLTKRSINSPWVLYETGILEGSGKKVIPFLLSGEASPELVIGGAPEFISQYNVIQEPKELLTTVRQETFISGILAGVDGFSEDTFSELREARIELTFDEVPQNIMPIVRFGVLIIKFGHHDALSQVTDETAKRDGLLLNAVLPPSERSDDVVGLRKRIGFRIPVHKVLGVQFKFFVDVADLDAIPRVLDFLTAQGAVNPSQSGSAERQRIYFEIDHQGISRVKTPEGFGNNFLYPI